MRYFALTLLVGCSASAGGARYDGADEPTHMAGEPSELPTAGDGGADTDTPSAGTGGSLGGSVAKGGQTPGGSSTAGGGGVGGKAGGGTGGTTAGAGGGGVAGTAATAGSPSAGTGAGGVGEECPANYYCHELGADAFAKCVIEDQPNDPEFPGCKITRGTCYYPQTAPESCIKPECWSKKRTCD